MSNINKYTTLPTNTADLSSGDIAFLSDGRAYILSNSKNWQLFANGLNISQTDIANWNDAYAKAHTHANKSALDIITIQAIDNWDTAYSQRHTHANKAVLDAITQTKVDGWDAMVANGATQTWVNTNFIPKTHPGYNVTQAKIDNWDAAFGWGNHALAGYVTQAIADSKYLQLTGGTLTGDVIVNDGKKFAFNATTGEIYEITGTGTKHTSGSNVFTQDFINTNIWGIRHGSAYLLTKDFTNNIIQLGHSVSPPQIRLKMTGATTPNQTVVADSAGGLAFLPGVPLSDSYLNLKTITDANSPTTAGVMFNYMSGTASNMPVNFTNGTVFSLNFNGGSGSQMAFNLQAADPAVYFRQRVANTWGSWLRLATTTDLINLGNDYISKSTNDLPSNSQWYVRKNGGDSSIGVIGSTDAIGLFNPTTKAYLDGEYFRIVGGGISTDMDSSINGYIEFNGGQRFNSDSQIANGKGLQLYATSDNATHSALTWFNGSVNELSKLLINTSTNRLHLNNTIAGKSGFIVTEGDNPIIQRNTEYTGDTQLNTMPVGTHGYGSAVAGGINGSVLSFGIAGNTQSQIIGSVAGIFKARTQSGATWNSWKTFVNFEDLALSSNETQLSLTFDGVTKTATIPSRIFTPRTYNNDYLAAFSGQGYIDFELPANFVGEIIMTAVGYWGSYNATGILKTSTFVGSNGSGIYAQNGNNLVAQGNIINMVGVNLSAPFVYANGRASLRVWSLDANLVPNQVRIFIEAKTSQGSTFTSSDAITAKAFVADTNIPLNSITQSPRTVSAEAISLKSTSSGDSSAIRLSTALISTGGNNSNAIRVTGTNNNQAGYILFGNGTNILGVDASSSTNLLYNSSPVVTRAYAIANGYIFSEGSSSGTINGWSADKGLPVNSFKPVKSGFYRPNGDNGWCALLMGVAHPTAGVAGAFYAGIGFDYSGTEAYLTGADSTGTKLPNKKLWHTGNFDPTQYLTQSASDARYLRLTGGTMTGSINLDPTTNSFITRDYSTYNVTQGHARNIFQLTDSTGILDTIGYLGAINNGVFTVTYGYLGATAYNTKAALRWKDGNVGFGLTSGGPTAGYTTDTLGNALFRGNLDTSGNFNRSSGGDVTVQVLGVNKFRAGATDTIVSGVSAGSTSGIYFRPLGDTDSTAQTLFTKSVAKYTTKQKFFDNVGYLTKFENVASLVGASGSQAGNIKITFPTTGAGAMWVMKVRLIEYVSSTSVTNGNQSPMELTITGYNSAAGSQNVNISVTGKSLHNNFVGIRIGYDASNNKVIWLDFNAALSYPKVIIDEVILHHAGSSSVLYDNDWLMEFTSDETGYTNQNTILANSFKELVTDTMIADWNTRLSTNYNNPITASQITSTDFTTIPNGSYIAAVSTTNTNLPFAAQPGGLISFGGSSQTTRILGARDGSDNLWFQSGNATNIWRQIATRDYVSTQISASTNFPLRALTGGTTSSIRVEDTRNTNPLPSTDLKFGTWFDFKTSSVIGLSGTGIGTYSAVMTMVPYTDNTGNNNTAFRLAQNSNALFFQQYTTAGWGSWNRIWTSNDFSQTNIGNWNTAFGWGNHALAGYATTTQLGNYIPTSQKGAANGVASLDSNGLVPSSQLPSYVDDVLEFATLSAFPATGETGKIYVATDTNLTYRWSGSGYIQIASGAVQSVNGQTGVVNLTKANIGLSNVDNTADSMKVVLSASKLTAARYFNFTGDAAGSNSFDGSGDVNISLTLSNTGVGAGIYKSVTVDAKGRIIAGTNPTTLAEYGITDAAAAADLLNYIALSQKGAANGVATLGGNGIIPSSQLPLGFEKTLSDYTGTFGEKLTQAINDANDGDIINALNTPFDTPNAYTINSSININKPIQIKLPSGIINFNGTGNIFNINASNVRIFGTGRSSRDDLRINTTNLTYVNGNGGYHFYARGQNVIVIANMDITGVRTVNYDAQQDNPSKPLDGSGGIYIEKSNPGTTGGGNTVALIILENLLIHQTKVHGIYLDTPILGSIKDVRISQGGGHGIFINGGTSMRIENCYVSSTHKAGYALYQHSYTTLISCASEFSGMGYWLRGCFDINLISCGAESNGNRSANVPNTNVTTTDSSGNTVIISDVGSDNVGLFRGSSYVITGGFGIKLDNCASTNAGRPTGTGSTVNSRDILVRGGSKGITIISPRTSVSSGNTYYGRFNISFESFNGEFPKGELVYNPSTDGSVVPTVTNQYISSINDANNAAPVFIQAGSDVLVRSENNFYTPLSVKSITASDGFLGNATSATTAATATSAATATKLETPRSISITGDASWTTNFDGSTNVTAALTLANSGVSAGTYKSVTVDGKGRVTAGTNPTTLVGYGITDAMSTSHAANAITSTKITNWDTAFGWGDYRNFGLGSTGVANNFDDFHTFTTSLGNNSRIFASTSAAVTSNAPTGISYPTGLFVARSTNVQSFLVFGGYNTEHGLAYKTKLSGGTYSDWIYAWTTKHFSQTDVTNWGTSYTNSITSIGFTSTTLTLNRQGAAALTIAVPTFNQSTTGNAATATKLQTIRKINGTNFDGTADITTTTWGTARTITIGGTGKSVSGSANVSWTLAEIGAAAISHTHDWTDITGKPNTIQGYGIINGMTTDTQQQVDAIKQYTAAQYFQNIAAAVNGGVFLVDNGTGAYAKFVSGAIGDEAGIVGIDDDFIAVRDYNSDFYIYGNNAIKVKNGYVSIGDISPSSTYRLNVSGDANVTGTFSATTINSNAGFFETSQRKFKTNIKPFEKSGLDLVNQLEIVTFDRTDNDIKDKIGIIIDDTPKEFASQSGNEVDLYKTIFVQAKAIQELNKEVDELKELVKQLISKNG